MDILAIYCGILFSANKSYRSYKSNHFDLREEGHIKGEPTERFLFDNLNDNTSIVFFFFLR